MSECVVHRHAALFSVNYLLMATKESTEKLLAITLQALSCSVPSNKRCPVACPATSAVL